MRTIVKKALLTLQGEVSSLKEATESFYRIARHWLRIPHESDFKALKLIRSDLQGCYVDIGANNGQSIESISLLKPYAQIVSFEPNARLAQKLKIRYKHRN